MSSTKRIAVVLVDMQDEFVELLDSQEKTRIIKSQIEVIRHCAENDIPLIILEYNYRGKTITELQLEIARVPRVIVVSKGWDDGFCDTKLDEKLKSLSVDTLLFMGINASFCVRATAEGAVRCGYKIITADNLIADARYNESHQKSRTWYLRNGVFLESPGAFLEQIRL